MQIFLKSLGCARNQVDSDGMLARLHHAGHRISNNPATADVIVVNTCSFIEAAADESIDTILALSEFKRRGRCKRLIVVGCLPERYREESVKALPEVDQFLGTGAFDQITEAVQDAIGRTPCLLPDPDLIDVDREIARIPTDACSAYVKIAEGCDRKCTYCIIPTLRGRQKSRAPAAIIREAETLIAGGIRELVLVAQETTAYGNDLTPRSDLAHLLEGLVETLAIETPKAWIRFLYGHPESLDDAVLKTVTRYPSLCPYFDIPIQHASDRILHRMGRSYTSDDLLRLFDKIRNYVPQAVLRTTLLTGFPGETDVDFQQLVEFVAKVGFDHLGVFIYSDSEDLPAHRLNDPVAGKSAQERADTLMTLQQELSAKNLRRHLNSEVDVLVESGPEQGVWYGRTQFQAPEVDGQTLIRTVDCRKVLTIGSIIKSRVIKTMAYDLMVEVKD